MKKIEAAFLRARAAYYRGDAELEVGLNASRTSICRDAEADCAAAAARIEELEAQLVRVSGLTVPTPAERDIFRRAIHRRAYLLTRLTAPGHPAGDADALVAWVARGLCLALMGYCGQAVRETIFGWLTERIREGDGLCSCGRDLRSVGPLCAACATEVEELDREVEAAITKDKAAGVPLTPALATVASDLDEPSGLLDVLLRHTGTADAPRLSQMLDSLLASAVVVENEFERRFPLGYAQWERENLR